MEKIINKVRYHIKPRMKKRRFKEDIKVYDALYNWET